MRKYEVTPSNPPLWKSLPNKKISPCGLSECRGIPVISAFVWFGHHRQQPGGAGGTSRTGEDVLWHEFAHVITLTATKNRMPRWLSEGISVYEERQAQPAGKK